MGGSVWTEMPGSVCTEMGGSIWGEICTHMQISNKEYQLLNDCSRNTASNDMSELLDKKILISSGKKGAGSFYKLKNRIAQ